MTLDNRLVAVPVQMAPEGRTFNPGAPAVLFAPRMAIAGNAGLGGALSKAQYAVASDGRLPRIIDRLVFLERLQLLNDVVERVFIAS